MKITYSEEAENFVRESLGLEELKPKEKGRYGYFKEKGKIKEIKSFLDLVELTEKLEKEND